jgi:pyruvate formate lyase activating enzyme
MARKQSNDLLVLQILSKYSDERHYLTATDVIDLIQSEFGLNVERRTIYTTVDVLKEMGYEIKLDTNGTNYEVLKMLIDEKLIDYVAMDIKNGPSYYKEISGKESVDLEVIKKSINLLINSGIDYEFRTTLVKEYFSFKSIKEMGEFIKGAKQLYLQKFVSSENCINKDLHEVNEKEANEYASLLNQYIDVVELRGY